MKRRKQKRRGKGMRRKRSKRCSRSTRGKTGKCRGGVKVLVKVSGVDIIKKEG